MDLLGTRQVDPIHQSPQPRTYGFFTYGTVPTFLACPHLVSLLLLTVFVGCLPQPHFGRRLPGRVAFATRQVLFSRPTAGHASLATSRPLIGPFTPVPPGDAVSPPEVARCSSVPCRPHTPWYDGVNECAFVSIVQTRPAPIFGRPVHRRGRPHRLRPGTAPQALRIPPCDGHPALRSARWLQVRLGRIRLSPSCPCGRFPYLPHSPASEALPPLLD